VTISSSRIPVVFSPFRPYRVLVTMDHYIEDLNQNDVAEVEERTNANGDEISGILLVVF
jgi:hypothetical protein